MSNKKVIPTYMAVLFAEISQAYKKVKVGKLGEPVDTEERLS